MMMTQAIFMSKIIIQSMDLNFWITMLTKIGMIEQNLLFKVHNPGKVIKENP